MDSSIPTQTLAVVAAAFVLTLVLAGLLTPRSWWRRLTAGNLALVLAGTEAIAFAVLHFLPPKAALAGAMLQAHALPAPRIDLPGRPYRVAQALNLRASHGTSSARLGVVPAGALIHATGKRAGDWWQLRASIDGKTVTGWSNSLWLRRTDEAGMHVDVGEQSN